MRPPPQEQIDVAILWLENNEGEEREACRAVARWIEREASEQRIRRIARNAGLPVARVRQKLAELGETP